MFGQKLGDGGKLDLSLLHQGEVWTGHNGVTHRIEDMSEGHLQRVLAWLRRNAVHLDLADGCRILWAAPPDRYFDWEDDICERDPHEWIESLEVVEAMKLRLARYKGERAAEEAKKKLADVVHADYWPMPVLGTDW